MTNGFWSFGVLIACAVLGGVAGWLLDQQLQPRGVVYGVPPPVALAYHDLGATVDLTQIDAAGRAYITGAWPCDSIRWLRQPIHWSDVEKSPGQFDWPRLDLPLIDSYGRRLKVLALLQDSPAWVREANQPASAPPKDWRAIGAFARALAEHFRGQVDAYQIWDEPNIMSGWGGKYPSANEYMLLLREAAVNIRAVDPQAKIVSAALAPTSENGPLNLNEPEFLRQLYRAGAKDFFDAVGAEPFGFWTGPDDRRVDVNVLNFSRLILLREVMEANGDAQKAVWATAFGWSIAGRGDPVYGGDEPQVQGMRTIQAINRAQDEWPWLGPLIFTRWQPIGAHDPRAGFALFNPDGLPGPFTGMGKGCANIRVAPIGRYAADDWSAVYPQGWRVTPDGADIPQNDASPVTIGFRGTRFDLTVRRGNYEAFLFVKVDGLPANALPRDEQGRTYVVLYDPLAQTSDVTLARDLPDKEHFVELVPQGGWGQWAIAGWTVSRERADTGWARWLGALVGTVVGATIALILSQRQSTEVEPVINRLPSSVVRLRPAFAPLVVPLTFLAGALLYLSPSVALSWLLIGLLALLVLWRLDAGLALVALAIPFYLQAKPLGAGSYSVVEIVLLLCVLSFVLRQAGHGAGQWKAVHRRFNVHLTPLDYVVLLWVVAGALGVVVAENFGVANREWRVVFVEPALYYALIRATGTDGRTLLNAFLLGASVVAGLALVDWLTQRDLITAEGVLRVRSVYASPNNLALYLDRAVPLALCLTLFGQARRMLYFVAFVLMIVALYLTFAKGAWLVALPAALMLIGLLRAQHTRLARARLMLGALLVLAALALSLLPVLGTERLRSLFDLTTGTTFTRVQLWQSTLAMIRDHPVFGVGLDNFLYQYRTRYILPSAFAEPNLSHPHDIVLDFWTRLGLTGLVLLAALLTVFWRTALRLYWRLPDGETRALVLGLMASLVAALAHGLIDNSFFLVDLAFVLMLTLAIVGNLGPGVLANAGPIRQNPEG